MARDEVLTIADNKRHILLELPSDVFIDIAPLLARLRAADPGLSSLTRKGTRRC